jgi:hypothetical protein
MKRFLLASMISFSLFSANTFANAMTPIDCHASLARGDEDPRAAYFGLRFEPSHVATIKLPDEEEQVVATAIDIHQFPKEETFKLLNDPAFMYVAHSLHIDSSQVKTATSFKFNDSHGRYILLLSFFGDSGNALGSGGFVDLRAAFTCKST